MRGKKRTALILAAVLSVTAYFSTADPEKLTFADFNGKLSPVMSAAAAETGGNDGNDGEMAAAETDGNDGGTAEAEIDGNDGGTAAAETGGNDGETAAAETGGNDGGTVAAETSGNDGEATAAETGGNDGEAAAAEVGGTDEEITLRVCNWEEYIDLGGWDEEETIDLESGDIIGIHSMVEDFEEWYYEEYGIKVNVEYSTFGTNEDLYNMLTLGDEFDLVCPSEYMVMKLMAEELLVPLSDDFFDSSDPDNYYSRGVSSYIQNIFDEQEINGESWSRYMAGYMWGITGIVYNPEAVSEENASTWKILSNQDYRRRITIKDNVRDSYFAAVGALKSDLLTSEDFLNDPDYAQRLEDEMNDVSDETLAAVEEYLQEMTDNAYSLETDSGKADMITGKVVANYQWSGDGVYTMDQAEEDGMELCFTVPAESTNIYFDGWVMLKSGIDGDAAKQHAAEAFINFLSRPDNVIRNMYYVGYTSVISGGEDTRIFEYADWCYGAEDGEEETAEYPLGYFFSGDSEDADFVITAPADQVDRQLAAQYPSEETLRRASIMVYFDAETNEKINQMWIRVRCYDIRDVPAWARGLCLAVAAAVGIFFVRRRLLSHV